VFEALQKFLEWRSLESDIGPYCKLCQQTSGTFLGGIKLGDQVLVRSKTRNPALDFTRGNMFPQLREEACFKRRAGGSTSACAHQLTF
jgi:hypothetical protein